MILIKLSSVEIRYLSELVNTDANRMRAHIEHATSHGVRNFNLPEHLTAMRVLDVFADPAASVMRS